MQGLLSDHFPPMKHPRLYGNSSMSQYWPRLRWLSLMAAKIVAGRSLLCKSQKRFAYGRSHWAVQFYFQPNWRESERGKGTEFTCRLETQKVHHHRHYNMGTSRNVFFCSSIPNLIRSLLGCGCIAVHLVQNSSGGLRKCFCRIKKKKKTWSAVQNRTIGKHSTAASKQP